MNRIAWLAMSILAIPVGWTAAQEPTKTEVASEQTQGAIKPEKSPSSALNSEWEKMVRPILARHCLECHNSLDKSGKLDLTSIPELMRGGLSGSAVDREQPAKSVLLEVLVPNGRVHMPPEGQLDDNEIAQISKWIDNFAKVPIPEAWLPTPKNNPDASTSSGSSRSMWSDLPIGLNPSNAIDLMIESAWKSNQVTPATLASDAVFARRLFLDLVGRVPRDSEIAQFVNSTDSRKREQLVDTLLSSDEYATHIAEILDAILMGRPESGRAAKVDRSQWLEFLTKAIRENRPWNLVAKQVLLARPSVPEERGAVWYLYSRDNKHQDIAEAVSKDFFGVRIDCAQCHDHPLSSEIEQKHYWGLVAFFNRGKNVDTPNGPRIAESAIGGFSEFANIRGKTSLNQLVYLRANPIDEARPAKDAKEEDRDDLYLPAAEGEPKVPKFSRREQFVEKVLNDNPLVAQAMVNRMWGWMFGRGLVHPVDAIDSFHPASHPELLDWLARDFAQSNYDLRRLMRHLALSRTYQLESTPMGAQDPKWFASGIAKPLTAESLYRSFQIALDVNDASAWNSPQQRQSFAKLFPDVLTEESLANVSQGLWLTNGDPLQKMISAKQSKLVQQVAQAETPEMLVELLFARIFGRRPDVDETNRCIDFLQKNPNRREQQIESLVWALLTTAEFRFNH